MSRAQRRLTFTFVAVAASLASTAGAASPTVDQALKLVPTQTGIDFDRPTAEEVAKCTIKAESMGEHKGWVVRDANGQILRQFADTNGDNVVDLWCYFRDGIEVFRDVDANFNNKADQHRWLNTAGLRWGIDEDEDGVIDIWKTISAEEVSAEVVRALATRQAAGLERLLLTPEELGQLGLGQQREEQLAKKLADAVQSISTVVQEQKSITPKTNWLHFGATQPGIVPAHTDSSSKDLFVYENVVAVVETDGKHDQILLGTLVRVGDVWRLIDAPKVGVGDDEPVAGGFFFQSPLTDRPETAETPAGGVNEKTQNLLAELEKLDDSAVSGKSAEEQARLHARRADILEELAAASDGPEDRGLWLRQLADMVSAAAQSGAYPGGVARLETMHKTLSANEADKALAAYVKFRHLTADYGLTLAAPNADFVKIQEQWLESLKAYVEQYPESEDAAEAMLQLGIAREFAGQEDEAKEWYGKIASAFPDAPSAKKATGAIRRLDSVGKPLVFKGQGVNGKPVDLAQYKGSVVLIHYWATWCEPCKAELNQLNELLAKYSKQGFHLIGVSLDTRQQDLAEFLGKNRLPWAQIYEPGGLDSRMANELGVLTLPLMILVDAEGRVVNRGIHVSQVEAELKNHLPARGQAASKPSKPTTNRR